MPRKKSYVRQVKVNLSRLELAYLAWLDKKHQRGFSDLIREAIREQMARMPKQQNVSFRDYAGILATQDESDPNVRGLLEEELLNFFGPREQSEGESDSLFDATTFAVLPKLGAGEIEFFQVNEED